MMTTDPVGGVWQYSLALASTLAEQWHCRVALVCLGRTAATDPQLPVPAERIELVELPHKLEWMPDSSRDVEKALQEVARLANSWKADILHSNQFCFGKLGRDLPTVVVAHSDVLSWHRWHRGTEVELDRQLGAYRDLVSAGLAGAGAVVCPSEFAASCLKSTYGSASKVIYNGLPPGLFRSGPKEQLAAVAGRLWDESKMADVAVRAVDGLPIQLELAGPTIGPNGEESHLPGATNARYIGAISWQDTRRLLARARFYLATSSYEPFGLAALEAALSGCALVAANTPSYREIWGDSAVYYEPGSADGLRSALAALLVDDARVEALASAAMDRALARYTADRMAAEYRTLYTHVRNQRIESRL